MNAFGSIGWQRYQDLLALEQKSRPELEAVQRELLTHLLRHASEHNPYYRDLLREHDVVAEIGTVCLQNFSLLPLLTKGIIREQGKRMQSDDHATRKSYMNSSGGSTGVPVEFMQDRVLWETGMGAKLYFCDVAGKHPGDREVKLWGSERDIFKGSIGLSSQFKNWVFNRHLQNSFRMSPEVMEKYVEELNRFKPRLIWSYVDSAYELAKFIESRGLTVHSPKAIVVTAGTLYEPVRTHIERIFQSKVLNQYGSREVGAIAAECPAQEGLHVFENLVHLELLDTQGQPVAPGEVGEIIVTPLSNYSMPLLRYRIGDTGIWSTQPECSCGRPFRLLERVTGRVTDHFKTASGEIIHGEYFTHLFYHLEWVQKFKVTQHGVRAITVEIVLRDDASPVQADVHEIEEKIQLVMGVDCQVTFEYVDTIAPSPSGKYLYTESKLTNTPVPTEA
ncbi:MAG: phenylacetate--CoA ligase family protein [Candidatus Doudnabacteria bacterium]|nr:phenylacetate--CoA ligase family protein [Candidatus Doudnabacteria bacterium]